MWDPVVERLDGARRVLALDLPGHGVRAAAGRRLAARARRRDRRPARRRGDRAPARGGQLARRLDRARDGAAGRAASVTAIAPAGLWREPLVPKRSRCARSARGAAARAASAAAHRARPAARARRQRRPPGAHPAGRRAAPRPRVRHRARLPGRQRRDAREPLHALWREIAVPVTLAWPEHDRLVRRPRSLPDGARWCCGVGTCRRGTTRSIGSPGRADPARHWSCSTRSGPITACGTRCSTASPPSARCSRSTCRATAARRAWRPPRRPISPRPSRRISPPRACSARTSRATRSAAGLRSSWPSWAPPPRPPRSRPPACGASRWCRSAARSARSPARCCRCSGPLLRTRAVRRVVLAANAARPERIPPADALRLVRSYATAPGFEAVNDAMRAGRFTRARRHRRAGHAGVAGPRPARGPPAVVARRGSQRGAARVRAPADVGRPGAGGSRVAGGQRGRTSTPALRERDRGLRGDETYVRPL